MVSGGGRLMAAEIQEQPRIWSAIVRERQSAIAAIADTIHAAAPRFVLLAARGTSDHAALYGKYLVETVLGLPAGLASPSTITTYGARPDLRDVLLIGISQSGGSPDLIQTMATGAEQGAFTLAITNEYDSPITRASEHCLYLAAGPERAVAATKSYTAQLLTLYLLVRHLKGSVPAAVGSLPAWGEALLADGPHIATLAERYRFAQRMVLSGRGYSYPTAREAGLKLMETCYLSAQAFSGADLLHGPVAMLDAGLPVVTIVPSGRAGAAMQPVVQRLESLGVDQLCVGSEAAVRRAGRGAVIPGDVPEELSPLLEILPLQQLALHLALSRGEDPDVPRGLAKVTETV